MNNRTKQLLRAYWFLEKHWLCLSHIPKKIIDKFTEDFLIRHYQNHFRVYLDEYNNGAKSEWRE